MRTRIKDVAARARARSADVSRILHDRVPNVAEATGVRHHFARGLRHYAVICVSDPIAADYLLHDREVGIRLPEDFPVIGFDTNSFREERTPHLTSVLQPLELKGTRAVNLVVRCIDRAVDIPSLIIPCSLETGDSTLSIATKEIIP